MGMVKVDRGAVGTAIMSPVECTVALNGETEHVPGFGAPRSTRQSISGHVIEIIVAARRGGGRKGRGGQIWR